MAGLEDRGCTSYPLLKSFTGIWEPQLFNPYTHPKKFSTPKINYGIFEMIEEYFYLYSYYI